MLVIFQIAGNRYIFEIALKRAYLSREHVNGPAVFIFLNARFGLLRTIAGHGPAFLVSGSCVCVCSCGGL